MMFLEQSRNPIPTPKPLGMVTDGAYTYLFMSYVKGDRLDKIWPGLNKEHKGFIQKQLNVMFGKLRDLPCPKGYLLGGVGSERCKDTRRKTRTSQTPIHNTAEFEDFIFSDPTFGSPVWVNFLRQMLPMDNISDNIFTHSDLRPANIMVALDQDCSYKICGIIDWERSGFYPDCSALIASFQIDPSIFKSRTWSKASCRLCRMSMSDHLVERLSLLSTILRLSDHISLHPLCRRDI